VAARLTELRGGRAGAIWRVGRRELVIGRDESCELVVDDPRVSREHARIEPRDGEHFVVDLGSRNGTRVNGQPVTRPVGLRDGDQVQLGDAVVLRYELVAERSRMPLMGSLALLGVLLVASAIFFALRTDPVMTEAANTARSALAASDHGDAAHARDLLSDAVATLYEAGRLDDVPRLHVREEALRRIGRALGPDVDLVAAYRAAVESGRARSVAAAPPGRGPCRLDEIDAADLSLCVRERAEAILVDLWQDPSKVPDSFYRSVQDQLVFSCAATAPGSPPRWRAARSSSRCSCASSPLPKFRRSCATWP